MAQATAYIGLPRTTLDIVTANQAEGLQQQRALFVGQMAGAIPASGTILFTVVPANNDTFTLNGTAWTFKTSGATGNQINISAGNLTATLAAAVVALNASVETQTAKCFYWQVGNAILVQNKTGGTAGNSYTLAASVATVSAGTLLGGLAAPGTQTPGTLVSNVSLQGGAAINTMFGQGAHLSQMINAYRKVNGYTVADALPLADASGATFATAQITIAGTATAAGSLFFAVENGVAHNYECDLVSGNTGATIISLLESLIGADMVPFTYATDGTTCIQFMARNAGLHANDWLLAFTGAVPGITITLTGWAGGANNPSLTTLFNPIANVRYQTIVWPGSYTLTKVSQFLDARKNVNNDVQDGRAIAYQNVSMSQAMVNALGCNSSEMVIMFNQPTSQSNWYGPHLPAAPDTIAARFAACRDLRFEDGINISNVVSTNAPNDQFGSMASASLPYFNTPLVGVGLPAPGSGITQAEQVEVEGAGVSVVGVNRGGTGIVMGVVVTTWINDTAGNPDTTWKYLEWRDTHGVVREYLVINLRKRFEQYRLTGGDLVPNYSIANVPMISGYIMGLYQDLQNDALVQAGSAATQFLQNNLQVTLNLASRTANVISVFPIISQLENIVGSIQFSFSTS
jgi:phage tail sheath gpL-like